MIYWSRKTAQKLLHHLLLKHDLSIFHRNDSELSYGAESFAWKHKKMFSPQTCRDRLGTKTNRAKCPRTPPQRRKSRMKIMLPNEVINIIMLDSRLRVPETFFIHNLFKLIKYFTEKGNLIIINQCSRCLFYQAFSGEWKRSTRWKLVE